MSPLEHVKYIRASKDDVWEALTNPQRTRKYYLDHGAVQSDFVPGSPILYQPLEDGPSVVTGEVIEAERGRRLSHSFHLRGSGDPPSRVTWDIAGFGNQFVKLTLTHHGFEAETETYRTMKTSWANLLCRLQTLLENGGHGWQ
jgi:uncharacterized protein YndB with AHSA1/START domain